MTGDLTLNFSDIHKICTVIHILTKMDVQFMNSKGTPLIQFVNHKLPSVFKQLEEQYNDIINNLKKYSSNYYYHYINSYHLEYVACGIWDKDCFHGAILIGHFTSVLPSNKLISDILSLNKLPISERTHLHEFYNSLSVISSNYAKYMGSVIINLCDHHFVEPVLISSEIIYPITNREDLKKNINDSKSIIEYRYKIEKELLNAVTKGDIQKVNLIMMKIVLHFIFKIVYPKVQLGLLKI